MVSERGRPGGGAIAELLESRRRQVGVVHELLSETWASGALDAQLVQGGENVDLGEDPPLPAMQLQAVLSGRSSRYSYPSTAPAREELAALLRWSAGPQREVRLPDGGTRRMSTAPSAGGLPSIDVYVGVLVGGEVPCGVYRWDRTGGRLVGVWGGDSRALWRAVLAQPEFADRAPMILALVARLDTTLVKYPARHYRTVHIDTGIVLQNLYLTATCLGLGGCAVTGFDDEGVTTLLRLDEWAFPTALYCVGRR